MSACDVVIVGAGFAGLACARQAARAGLKVVVLERKTRMESPIHTTGILVKEAQEEWAAPAHLVREISRVRVYAPSLRSAALERSGYFFLATDTGGLLRWLMEETRTVGADIHLGKPFEGAKRQGRRWIIETAGLECRYLVGADGARSRVAKSLELDRNCRYLKGVEYAFETAAGDDLSLHCFVDARRAPGYIGWVLPGVGVMQVGMAHHSAHAADFSGFIERIDSLFGLSERAILEKRGGVIPIGGLLNRFSREGAILIGDAAGMVSPLTAGGIHRAYRYGRLAGVAIAGHLRGGGPDPGRVMQKLYPRRAWQHAARWAFDHLPAGAIVEGLVRTPPVFRAMAGNIFFDRMNWRE